MGNFPDLFFTAVFLAGILGLIVAGVLFYANRSDTFSSRLLAGFMVCISLFNLNFALQHTGFFLVYPHLWRVTAFISFWFGPLAYLYVRSVLEQSYKFRKWDFIFFLPGLLHAVNLIPYYILPVEEKISFLSAVNKDPRLLFTESEAFLGNGTGALGRLIIGILSTIGQFILLRKWRKENGARMMQEKQNQETYDWLYQFTLILAIFYGIIIVEYLLQIFGPVNLMYVMNFTTSATIFFICIYLLIRPTILYGIKGWRQQSGMVDRAEIAKVTSEIVAGDSRKTSLTAEQGASFRKTLEEHFVLNKPFRKKGYTISELAEEISIPRYLLSVFINQEYAMNFNELINERRVKFLCEEIDIENEYSHLTLEALGQLAGFNTRSAFISAVKKTTGKNPSEVFGRKAV